MSVWVVLAVLPGAQAWGVWQCRQAGARMSFRPGSMSR